ncbi:MAG: bifunctional 5,10-methylenetetrahydrofolate dehydrogenase/5,10-methenyltetrahydrofolate cyclohydrolase [Fidelibacterota bacterium]
MSNTTSTLILSGKEVAAAVYDRLEATISSLASRGVVPGLAAVLMGSDPASEVYVRMKTKRFAKLNLHSETIYIPNDMKEHDIVDIIVRLNENPEFHGILVQLPLPKEINTDRILNTVSPVKDVDGFHPENLGRLASGQPRFIPCTPKGILEILKFYHISPQGKHVVVVGRSNIVGRPMSLLLGLKNETGNATVTVCHSRTPDIGYHTRQADIIIAAVGVPNLVNAEMVSPGTVIIDVGVNRVDDKSEKGYHLEGDVDFDGVQGIASAITPVPGGVGPMTIAMLVQNTVDAAKNMLT